MQASEAAEMIQAIIGSLERDPKQFHVTQRITGLEVTASAPGSTGFVSNVTGGGIGTQISVTAGGQNVGEQGSKAETIHELTSALTAVVEELNANEPNKERAIGLIESIKGKAPDLVVTLATKLIEAAVISGIG